jgi:hypothetical protein
LAQSHEKQFRQANSQTRGIEQSFRVHEQPSQPLSSENNNPRQQSKTDHPPKLPSSCETAQKTQSNRIKNTTPDKINAPALIHGSDSRSGRKSGRKRPTEKR